MLTYLEAQEAHNDLLSLIHREHLGLAPHVEGNLRQILQRNSFNIHMQVLYGQEVSLLQRIKWQELGLDPESEDEVYNSLRMFSIYKQHLLPAGKKCAATPYNDNRNNDNNNNETTSNANQENIAGLANRLDQAMGGRTLLFSPIFSPIGNDQKINPMGFSQQQPEAKLECGVAPPRECDLPKKRKKRIRRR